MTTPKKLWLGFGTLTALLLLTGVAITLRVRDIDTQVEAMAGARDVSAVTRQLEVHIVGFALDVRTYLQTGDPRLVGEAEENAAGVERGVNEYTRLANTQERRAMAARFVASWAQMRTLGRSLLSDESRAPDPGDMQRLYDLRSGLQALLNDEMQTDAVAVYNARKDSALKDARTVEVYVLSLLMIGALVAIATSILVGNAVVGTEARKTAMFQTALDAIISIDHRGNIVEFNPAAERTFGYKRDDVMGRELATCIIPPTMREAHRRGLAKFLATGEGPVLNKRIELTALRADGAEFPVELAITRIPVGGPPLFTAYLRDITERRNAEQSLRQARDTLEDRVRERTAELAESVEALGRSNRELEQFAAVASHDLQEPLRKIQAFGDRLQERCAAEVGEQGREYLERILSSAGRMRTLINDLLAFSRVTSKAQPFAPTDLNAIARDAVSDLETRIHQTGGRVAVAALPMLEADPMQMRQLFQNLIGNALKFRRPDTPPFVRVSARVFESATPHGEGRLCEIAVEDNGIGFEEVYLDRIFELFQRLHGRHEYEGTGMGLAICRKIVERHSGSITAKSIPGQGTSFLVTLPVRQARVESIG